MDKITVITITRNNHDELMETIRSLKLLPDHRLIVVNGGDCERTRQFLSEQKIEHVSEPDRGIADAFNKGVLIALKNSTDYVVFVNSGDSIFNASYAACAIDLLDSDKKIAFTCGGIVFRDSRAGDILIPARALSLGRGMPSSHQAIIYRKSIFEEVGLFDNAYKMAMDYEHLCRMTKKGFRGKYVASPPFVIMNGEGVSSVNEWRVIKESFRALKDNCLIFGNMVQFLIRVFFFFSRQILILLGLDGILARLKRIKYPSPVD